MGDYQDNTKAGQNGRAMEATIHTSEVDKFQKGYRALGI
jgi:hypothetical protein